MKTYIIHYSKGDGREDLESMLPGAHFITQYDREDTFCSWLKYITNSKLCMSYISCNIKHFEALKDMVDNNIKEAFIFEDDVVLIEDWESKFMEIKMKYFENVDYIKMGCLQVASTISIENAPLMIGNNGGTEGQYVTLKFANELLDKINMDNTIDHVHHGLLGKNIPCIPVCAQTSIIARGDMNGHQTETLPEWTEYVRTYHQRSLFKYDILLKYFEIFTKRKLQVEELFFKKYNKRVDIKHIAYIYRNEFIQTNSPTRSSMHL
jgi:GR25 family glycosyltransferase involved in LPS biosynthesis